VHVSGVRLSKATMKFKTIKNNSKMQEHFVHYHDSMLLSSTTTIKSYKYQIAFDIEMLL